MADPTESTKVGRGSGKPTAQQKSPPPVTPGTALSTSEASKPTPLVTLEQFNKLAEQMSELSRAVSLLSSHAQHGRDVGGVIGISSPTYVTRSSTRVSTGGSTVMAPRRSISPKDNNMSMQGIDGARYVGVDIHPTHVVGASSSAVGVTPAESSSHLYTTQMNDPNDSGWRELAMKSSTKAPRLSQYANNVGVWMRVMVSWLRLIHGAHLELGEEEESDVDEEESAS